MLYWKVLLRMGRANIELGDLSAAQSTYDTLRNMSVDSQQAVSIDQMKQLLSPFEKHLNAKKEYQSKNPEVAALSKGKGDLEVEMDSSDASSIIHLSDVCCHISKHGRGTCFHPFVGSIHPDGCSCPPGMHSDDDNCMEDEFDFSDRDSSHSMGSGCHPIRRDGNSVNNSGAEDEEPELVNEDEDDFTEDKAEKIPNECSDDDDGSEEAIDITKSMLDCGMACVFPTSSVAAAWAGGKGDSDMTFEILNPKDLSSIGAPTPGQGSKSSKRAEDASLDLNSVLKMVREQMANSPKGSRGSSAGAMSMREKTSAANKTSPFGLKKERVGSGFKRGFLESSYPLSSERTLSKDSNDHVSKAASSQQSYYVACYESDKDDSPFTAGLLAERKDEDGQILKLEKELSDTDSRKKWAVLRNVLDDVLGKSFRMTRTIDFARIFGHHVSSPGTSKRKRKSCVANCGTCFARKMWGIRFICTDYREAEDFLKTVENDPRRNASTFLPAENWQHTGYYACGYEMAFDVPALIHGVAYICHLQSELHWRGDKVPLLKDIQNSFISSLHRNISDPSNIHLLFMIFFMLRDTVKLFELFPDPSVTEGKRSFQFAHTASNAARSVLSSSVSAATTETSRRQLLLSTKTESLARNTYNWALLGQMAREERWIYNFLLRDVSHLILTLRNTVPRQPSHLESGETFSEAFKKACGERANDERYWKCRIVTIVERDRCRMIERTGDIARRDGDLERSVLLYLSAIGCRPQQPRLLFRLAQIRASQRKWKECLTDIRKAVTIVTAHHRSLFSTSNCSASYKCLLVDLHMLEGDALIERSLEADDNALESVSAALESYKEAEKHVFKDDVLKNVLEDKILATSRRYDTLASDVPKAEKSKKKKSKIIKDEEIFEESIGKREAVSAQVSAQQAVVSSDQERSSSFGQGSSADHSRGKRRRSHKAKGQPITTPTIISNTTVQAESSSGEDELDNSLVGNPYAALLDGETLKSSSKSAPKSVSSQKPMKPLSSSSRNTLIQSDARRDDHNSASTCASKSFKMEERKNLGSSLHPTRLASSVLQCTLCAISFGSRVDYESHMRGRRHRTAVAKKRASEIRDYNRSMRENQQAEHSSPNPCRASSSNATIEEHLQPGGPTREEALAEAERAMAILGGEARPCDVVSRMNLSKWNVQDVNAYLEKEFGGLLALCQAQPDVFELRPGSESRPVLMLINRVRNPRSRRRYGVHQRCPRETVSFGRTPPPIVPRQQATSRFPADDSEFPALGSRRYDEASPLLERMMNDLLHVSDGQSTVHGENASSKVPMNEVSTLCNQTEMVNEGETCGICYDKKPNVRCMPCKHEWCEDCIMDNIKRGRMECPMCMGHVSHLESLAGELD